MHIITKVYELVIVNRELFPDSLIHRKKERYVLVPPLDNTAGVNSFQAHNKNGD